MKPDLYIKTEFGLVPRFESEYYNKLSVGDVIELTIKKPRNPQHHEKFWALLRLTFDNQDVYNDIEFMREELTKAAGFFDAYINHKGVTTYKAKSISFASMDQEEFETFYQHFMDTICNIWGFDPELLENEILEQ